MKPIPINQLTIPQINATIKHALQVGGQELVIRKEQDERSIEQNRKLHAMLTDIANQIEHYGQKLNVTIWKRLTTAAWLREIGHQPQMIPAIDGHGVDVIFERTSKLSMKQMASLIQWVEAFGVEKGVRFSAPRWVSDYE